MATGTPKRNLALAPFQFMKEARDELRKVSWPSRPTTIRYTIIVIVSSLVIGGIDYGFTSIVKNFIL